MLTTDSLSLVNSRFLLLAVSESPQTVEAIGTSTGGIGDHEYGFVVTVRPAGKAVLGPQCLLYSLKYGAANDYTIEHTLS